MSDQSHSEDILLLQSNQSGPLLLKMIDELNAPSSKEIERNLQNYKSLVPRMPFSRVPWKNVWKNLFALMIANKFVSQYKKSRLVHIEYISVPRDEHCQDDEESWRKLNDFSWFVAAIRRSFSLSLETTGAAAAILAGLEGGSLEQRRRFVLNLYYFQDYFKKELLSWRLANRCLFEFAYGHSELLTQIYTEKLFEAADDRICPLKLMKDAKNYFCSELHGEDRYKGKGILLSLYIQRRNEKEFNLYFPDLDRLKKFIRSGEAISRFQELGFPSNELEKAIEGLNTEAEWNKLYLFVKYLNFAVQLVGTKAKTTVLHAGAFLSNYTKCVRGPFPSLPCDVRLRHCFYHFLAKVPYHLRKTKSTLATEERPRKKRRL